MKTLKDYLPVEIIEEDNTIEKIELVEETDMLEDIQQFKEQ